MVCHICVKKAVYNLYVAGSTVAQVEVFFSSDCLRVVIPFLCFIIVCEFA